MQPEQCTSMADVAEGGAHVQVRQVRAACRLQSGGTGSAGRGRKNTASIA